MRATRILQSNALILVLFLGLLLPAFAAETRITAPKNPYSPGKDYELGRQAAGEVERKLQLVRDPQIESYVQGLGRRLAESIPPEFRHQQFRYSYKVVDAQEINAFALPGGFTYVNIGLIAAASNEGELAGVMAHEISHVALRHGTAQVAKARKYQGLALGGAILGMILGGGAGAAVYQGTQLGVGGVLLRFSRDYEKQADLLGSQIMARAGYDPRDLANMFRTIERQGGKSGPQWMSDHPNPANRYEYINKEAQTLAVNNPIRHSREFNDVKARIRGASYRRGPGGYDRRGGYPREEEGRYPRPEGGYDREAPGRGMGSPTGRVAPPSRRFREVTSAGFRMEVPDNWEETSGSGSTTFAPEGGFGQVQGQPVFTHGALVGVVRTQSRNLRQATDAFLNELLRGNRNVRKAGGYEPESIAGRQGLSIMLSNVSEATGRPESVVVCTAFSNSGQLFYFIGVAPDPDFQTYERTFQRMVQSISLN
jgi:hypothetical protein